MSKLVIAVGETVRQCSSCNLVFSNHLKECPHCGSQKYSIKTATREDIERSR